MRQYVAIMFNPWDRRSYTYHHDGESVSIGDHVEVVTKDGPQTVKVVAVHSETPAFETKPISRFLRRAEGKSEKAVE
jgi:hypothetical protein